MDLLVAVLIFAAVLGVLLAIVHGGRMNATHTYELLRQVTRDAAEDSDSLMRTERRPTAADTEEKPGLIYRIDLMRRLEQMMWQAGIYVGVSEMLLIIVLLFGTGLAAGETFFHDNLLALAMAAASAAAPFLYVRFRRKRRLKAFAAQLPFALDLIKSSLEAGHSLLRALQVLVQEFSDPISGEVRTVLEQVRLGMALPHAFEEMYARVPQDDLRLLVIAVKVQSEVGSSLAQIVSRLSEIVRTRQRLHAQVRSMTAQSRMSGMIVGLLPVIVLAAFSLIQPSYVEMLFHDPAGLLALKAAIVLDLMALLTIRRILRVDY
jgi:tight adherence protein B